MLPHAHRVAPVPLVAAPPSPLASPSLCSRLSLWPPFGLLAGLLAPGWSRPTLWSVTWTWVCHIQHWTVEDSRLWQKAFLFLREVQLTLDTTMRGLAELSVTELRWSVPGASKNAVSWSCWFVAPAPDWLCSRAKSAAVGLGQRRRSCACWPKRKPDQSHPSVGGEWSVLGKPGGVRSCPALPHRSWLARC